MGVVTSDVVKHLSGQEVQRGPQGDRLPGLAAHLVGQQRCCLTVHMTVHEEPISFLLSLWSTHVLSFVPVCVLQHARQTAQECCL